MCAAGIFFLSGPLSLSAAPEPVGLPVLNRALTLNEAVALANSLTLKEALADADAASAGAQSARAQASPSLSTTTYGTTGDSSNIFTTSPGVAPQNLLSVPPRGFADQNLMLMIPLYTGGRIAGRIQAGRSQAAAARASLDAARLSLVETVTEAYATVLLRQSLADAAQSRLTAEDEQVRVTQEKVNMGRSAPVDLLREQAEQADARQALLRAQNDAALALVSFKVTLGVSQDSPLTLSNTLDGLARQPITLPSDLQEAQRLALAHRPELVAAAQTVEASKAAVKDAQGANAPQVYGVAMGDAMALSQGPSRAGYSIGITASLPLVDGGQRRADVNAAKARLARAEAEEQVVQQQIIQDVSAAWLTLQTAIESNKAALAGATAAREAYRLSDLRYNAGKTVVSERLDALAALTRAQGSLAQTMSDLVGARAALQKADGARS